MVDGQRLRFGFHGIWQGLAVLYDRGTQSQWLHLTGECMRGPLKGRRLERVSGLHTTWLAWRKQHPQTTVMAVDPKFAARYFPEESARRGIDFFPPEFPGTIRSRDERLPLSTLVYGVADGEQAMAIPLEEMRSNRDFVVQVEVGRMPVVFAYHEEADNVIAFDRRLGDETLRFQPQPKDGQLISLDGSRFDLRGRGVAGPRQGQQLRRVGLQAEWYGWYAAHPTTMLLEPDSNR